MRRLSTHLLASGISASTLLLLPAIAFAGPPALPEAETAPPVEEEPPADPAAGEGVADDGALMTADGQPMPTDTQPAGPGEDVVGEEDPAVEGVLGGEGDASLDAGGEFDSEGDAGLDSAFSGGSETAADDSDLPPSDSSSSSSSSGDISMGALGLEGDDGPGMVAGRREPMMNTMRAGVGLFHTQLAEVGGKYTFRFHLGNDFFIKKNFFCCEGGTDGDRHARIRGAINLGFTFTEWTEVYFNISSSANNNTRDQGARQDPPSVFALGDMNFGVKGAYRFLNGGVGLGGQVGLGLLSGSERLRTDRVNFDFNVILGADMRYLTKKEVPVRITGNVGWTLDNSPKLVDDWSAIEDPLSREVLRFSSGVNHSRVTTKIAVDFPIRLGKSKQYGIDPVIEYNWDIATYQEDAFIELTEEFGGSPLPRSQAWLTLGLRANVYDGLFLNAAVDVGTTSPSYEFGPPVPPYQVLLGLGWSFDPKPRVKQVPVPVESDTPEPVLEGRILGRVADLEGNIVEGAKVSFPGLASNVILTDAAGMFTSFRFPEGPVTISVELPDGSVVEQMADVRVGEDAQVDILVEPVVAEDPVFDGTFLGKDGAGIPVEVVLDGMGIQESFYSDELGRIAIALPLGEYKATLKAEGYADKEITFNMTEEGALVEETLLEPGAEGASPAPAGGEVAETPLINGNKYRIRVKKGPKYKGEELSRTEGLDQLATFLNAHPEYTSIEIRVHTDDRGNPKKRSQARADAVVAYLVGKGVDAGRLSASGFGDRDPVAINLTSEGRAKNNRTEFKVKGYTGE